MKRRELLQLGLGGVTAFAAGGRETAGAAEQTPQPGQGQGPAPPQPPESHAVANLAAMSVED